MATSILESPQETATADLDVRLRREAAHISDRAQALMVSAAEALEDGARATRRAVKSAVEDLEDLKDETLHQVKRHPSQALAITFAAGVLVGLTTGWLADRAFRRLTKGH